MRLLAERGVRVKISLCVIAKNEETNLPTCLASVVGVAAETIVVDTGSSDRTVEIAKEYGAKVFYYEWNGDFSKARNYALKQAKGDWIVFLDADEYFTEESIHYLPQVIKKASKAKADFIMGRMVNYNADSGDILSVTPIVRVFKNDKAIRYKGAIHEEIRCDSRPWRTMDASEQIKLLHTGYTPARVQEKNKLQRNIEMLSEQLQEKPTDSTLWFYLSESFMGINHRKSMECAYKVIEYHNAENKSIYARNYINLLRLMHALNEPAATIREIIERAVRDEPLFPDFRFCLGEALVGDGRLHDALAAYEQGIKLLDNAKFVETMVYFTLAERLYGMGVACCRLKRWADGIKYLIEALKSDKFHFAAAKLLIRTLLKTDSVERISRFLEELYDYNSLKDRLYLFKVTVQIGDQQLMDIYANMIALPTQPKLRKDYISFLLLQKQYDSAVKFVNMQEKELLLEEEVEIKFALAVLLSNHKAVRPNELLTLSVVAGLAMYKGKLDENQQKVCLNLAEFAMKFNAFDNLMKHCPWLMHIDLLMQYAEMAFADEHYSIAVALYSQIVRETDDLPENVLRQILGRLGECFYYENNETLALQFLQDAHCLGLKTYRSYEIEVELLRKKNACKQAQTAAGKALEVYPESEYLKIDFII